MPEEPSGESQAERRYIGERVAAIEKIVEITLHGKGGVLDRLDKLDEGVKQTNGTVASVRETLAEATGGIKTAIWIVGTGLAVLVVIMNWLFRGHP